MGAGSRSPSAVVKCLRMRIGSTDRVEHWGLPLTVTDMHTRMNFSLGIVFGFLDVYCHGAATVHLGVCVGVFLVLGNLLSLDCILTSLSTIYIYIYIYIYII
jgi:hypothetical protein